MNKNEPCKVCYSADADTYFCIDASKDVLVKDKMNFAGMKEMFTADITKEKFRLYYHLDSKYGLIDTPQSVRKELRCYCFYQPIVVFDVVQCVHRLMTKSKEPTYIHTLYLCEHTHTRMYIYFLIKCIIEPLISSFA